MITAEVWSAIVRFVGEAGRPGAAFMTQLDPGQWVLITAKHLCNDDSEEIVSLRHPYTRSGAPVQIGLTREYADADLGDIAVFRLPEGTLEHLHEPIPFSVVHFGFTQEAYIMGFPYNLSFPLGHGDAAFPIVKRGIISAERHDSEGHTVLVIDVNANPGFSGGPLVFRDVNTQSWRFGGVVQQTVLAPAVEPTPDEPNPPKVPSGLSLVASAAQLTRFREATGR